MRTDVHLQRARILVDPPALVTADLLALGVGQHVVPHVVLPPHLFVAHQAEEPIIGRGKQVLLVGVGRNHATYNTRNTGCSKPGGERGDVIFTAGLAWKYATNADNYSGLSFRSI